jgi:hypothetical protein
MDGVSFNYDGKLVNIWASIKSKNMSKIINKGGINGIGEQTVNTQSKDFKALKNSRNAIAQQRSREELLNNQLLGLRFRMMSYLENSDFYERH